MGAAVIILLSCHVRTNYLLGFTRIIYRRGKVRNVCLIVRFQQVNRGG